MRRINKVVVVLSMILLCNCSLVANATGLSESVKSVKSDTSATNAINIGDPFLYDCALELGIVSNGLALSVSTHCDAVAEEIGCENVVLQEKAILGWKDIPVETHPFYDNHFYMGGAVYENAEAGKSYRLKGTHYAIIDGVKYTVNNITDWLVFDY